MSLWSERRPDDLVGLESRSRITDDPRRCCDDLDVVDVKSIDLAIDDELASAQNEDINEELEGWIVQSGVESESSQI